ncbi:sensor histidine kinase [Amycolatopsis sp. GM8]|uniref:sensor histidine kinase n=1 Tax=Amycolatopsis sp. GM8 TaxID=2896530 RepID=UPI0027DEC73C|nr:sensor histidine kinase [Amycolatopsis sp. GM8]
MTDTLFGMRNPGGCLHEAALYSSDDEFLDILVPFLEAGIALGEPALVALRPAHQKLLCGAMDPAKLTIIPADEQYPRPAVAIRRSRELFAGCLAEGATRIRAVGEVPAPVPGEPWDWWARYEAVVNHAYDDFPLWGLCPYDTRSTPEHAVADVLCTHPWLATRDGHVYNEDYRDPVSFLGSWRDAPRPEPEAGSPVADLTDPSAGDARQTVRTALGSTAIDPTRAEDFVMAVSEVVTNARVHGKPPVRLRLWCGAARAVATITDGGDGPADPFTGLVATRDSRSAGVGLWLAHQTCRHVSMYQDDEGFVVRLVC